MDDDFFEEEESIFGEDEVFDYIMLDEMEKETGKNKKNAGCLTSVIIAVSAIGCFTVAAIWIIQ